MALSSSQAAGHVVNLQVDDLSWGRISLRVVESRHFTDYEMVAGMISAFSVPSLDLKITLALLQGRESDLKYFLKDPWTPGELESLVSMIIVPALFVVLITAKKPFENIK